jgi:hypothetical protein
MKFFRLITAPFRWAGKMIKNLFNFVTTLSKLIGTLIMKLFNLIALLFKLAWKMVMKLFSFLRTLFSLAGKVVAKLFNFVKASPKLISFLIGGAIICYILLIIADSAIVWTIVSIVLPLALISVLMSYKRTRIIGVVLASIAVLVTAVNLFEAKLPQTNRVVPWIAVAFDRWSAKAAPDSIDVIYAIAKDQAEAEAARKMLDLAYTYLGREEVEIADSLKEAHDKKWGRKKEAQVVQQQSVIPSLPTNSQADSLKSTLSVNTVKLSLGEYQYVLKAGQETPVIDVPDCGRFVCNFSSPTYNYKIIYSDGTQYDGGPDVIIPRKTNVSFKIRANIDEVVTVKVSQV